jgi:hypothetical protein
MNTPSRAMISAGPVSAKVPFQGVEVSYEGVFTDAPLTNANLGPLAYGVAGEPSVFPEGGPVLHVALPTTQAGTPW